MIDGAPSVLYDAVALLPSEAAMDILLQESTVRDFVADAFAHCKFIGFVEAAICSIRPASTRWTRAFRANQRQGSRGFRLILEET